MEKATVPQDLLNKLHRLLRQVNELTERQKRGPRLITHSEANVARCESLLEAAHADDKAFRVSIDQKQLQLKSAEAKINELQIKLNQATSNKEYQTLLEQIAATRMANSVLEDEILESMDKVAEFKARVVQAEEELKSARERLIEVKKKVLDSTPLIEGDIERLRTEITTAEDLIPFEVRQEYKRVIRQHGDDALAILDISNGYSCSGCHQNVPLNVYNTLLNREVIFCLSCGRLLYLPEGHRLRKNSSEDDE